ncbi:MAG: iron-containing alcohol dehydrogenase [Bacteroidales bacterium]|nr:iron-containing alcohol dehydrogenase [Bacteroidales bacterium]
MKNFIFHNPVKIIFGKDQISKIAQEIPANARVLMTYGKGSIFKNGVYDQVKQALAGIELHEFGGIEPNPRYETLMKAVEIIHQNKLTFILAVGGGSVIDGSKFIAAAALYNGDPWDFLSKDIKVKAALPLGSILTLPATGSEMNGNSVVTRESSRQKMAFSSPLVYPQFSVMDPQTTLSLPWVQTANGIADTWIHVTEQYLTYPQNAPLNDRLAEGILKTLIEEAQKVLEDPNNYETRANLMWCSTMALNGLLSTGVYTDWATHQIGHELTALHGLDHALTLTIIFPGLMRMMKIEKREKLLQYAERVWNITQGSDDEKIEAGIEMTDQLFRNLGLKTRLSEHQITKEDIQYITDRFNKNGPNKLGEKGLITPHTINSILLSRL